MQFNHPEMLYGLFAVLIPILIHLFNFRRYKKLYFSNIQFLKNITQETRKQNKLKHLIVLLLRILAVIAIVFAFADPELSKKDSLKNANAADFSFVYIDNSFSMRALGNTGRLFDQAIADAKKLVQGAKRDHRFVLMHNGLETNNAKVLSKDLMLNELDVMTIMPSNRKLSSVIKAIQKSAKEHEVYDWNSFVFSDFQKSATDIINFPQDTLGSYYFVPSPQAQLRNIFIDSCWLVKPIMIQGKRGQLNVRLKNSADMDYEKVPLQLSIDGQKKAVAGVDLKARSQQIVHMDFSFGKSGWHAGLLEIEDYPITFDDKLYFSYEVKPAIKVLEIYGHDASEELSTFYQTDSIFNFTSTAYQRIDFNRMNDYHLIILNTIPSFSNGLQKQIKAYMEQGGNVLFLPDETASIDSQNQLLSHLNAGKLLGVAEGRNRVVGVKLSHDLFKNAISKLPNNPDLPALDRYFRYEYAVNTAMEPLISLLNGDVFFSAKQLGLGNLYLLSVSMDESFGNFATHALYVPIMYGVAISGNINIGMYHSIKQHTSLSLNKHISFQEQNLLIKEKASDYSFIPALEVKNGKPKLSFTDAIQRNGFYELVQDSSLLMLFAFNYQHEESVMEFYDANTLKDELLDGPLAYAQVMIEEEGSIHEVINSMMKQPAFWKLFIIFALSIILLEVLILRLWK